MCYEEVLRFGVENGIIDINSIQTQIEVMKRKQYLEQHNYNIWQGSGGKWYTYLPTETDRRLIKRTSKEAIEDCVVDFYKSRKEEPILNTVFQEWVDSKLDHKEISKGTYDRYCNDYKRFFNNTNINITRVCNITEAMLEAFIRKTIKDKELTAKGYSNLRTLIVGVFKYAKPEYTQISISTFFHDLDLSRKTFAKKSTKRETQVFSVDEVTMLTRYFNDNPTLENMSLLLAFQTGVRCGELAALKLSDYDGNSLHIQRQEIKYKDSNGKCTHEVVPYTKTEAGDRYIILPNSCIATLEKIKELNSDGEYMFEIDGKRIMTDTYNDRLYKACRICGIPERSMHKIRKTYGTTLIDADVDDSLIMRQMGHSDINTTRKYYYFANKGKREQQEQINNALEQLITQR